MRYGNTTKWVAIGGLVAAAFLWAQPAAAQKKFYPDDPIEAVPPPENTFDPQTRTLSGLLEYFTNTFTRPGERQPEEGVIPSLNANTLGEVPDSPWFVNRHARRPMTTEELLRGPGDSNPPSTRAPWRVLTVKPYGDRTGMLIADERNELYLLRLDPPGYLELATGAEMVASRFFYAMGYNVTENYIVYFNRDQLVLMEGAERITSLGQLRDLLPGEVDDFLKTVALDPARSFRAVATRIPPFTILGSYQIYGTRSDDPNDIWRHEHRRDLRGQWIFNAWMGHDDFNPVNTLDILVQENSVSYILHYLIDFFKALGSGEKGPKTAREGNEYRYNLNTALKNTAGMGIWTPAWMRADYPGIRSVGTFESRTFDPDKWKPDTHYATWANMLPDDMYWAAKIVMAFTDDDIRMLVGAGQYSDPRAVEWIGNALIERRDKIGRAFLAKVLPIDNFSVEGNEVVWDDLMETHGFGGPRQFVTQWSSYDNDSDELVAIGGTAADLRLPETAASAQVDSYWAGRVWHDDPEFSVFSVRAQGSRWLQGRRRRSELDRQGDRGVGRAGGAGLQPVRGPQRSPPGAARRSDPKVQRNHTKEPDDTAMVRSAVDFGAHDVRCGNLRIDEQ